MNSRKMSDFEAHSDSIHANGLIISGALWDLRPGERFATTGVSASNVDYSLFQGIQTEPTTFLDLGLSMYDYWLASNPYHPIIGALDDSWDWREMSMDGQHKKEMEHGTSESILPPPIDIDVYPNPGSERRLNVVVRGDDLQTVSLTITDAIGRRLETRLVKIGEKIDLSSLILAPGLYSIEARSGRSSGRKLFIVQ